MSVSHPIALKNSELPQICIRTMQIADLEQVIKIDRLSFSMPWPQRAFEYELLENPASFLLVAEADTLDGVKKIIGVIVVWLIIDEAHIATLAVHPDYRRRGVSRQLITRTLLRAIQAGMHTATLEVRSKNIAAQELYRSYLFEVVGRRNRYYKDDMDDAFIMTVDLLQKEVRGIPYQHWLEQLPSSHNDR